MVEDGDCTSKNVSADILVDAPPEVVWAVLTDYDQLDTFVPNLAQCTRLPDDKPGCTVLYQKGYCQTVFWRMEAAAVLEVTETQAAGSAGSSGRARTLFFRMRSGDFEVRPHLGCESTTRAALPARLSARARSRS